MKCDISFEPKWKEMLVGKVGDNQFTVEFTMGVDHVYFPTRQTWESSAPDWAKDLWLQASSEASLWANKKGIPFDIDAAAWVDFDQ